MGLVESEPFIAPEFGELLGETLQILAAIGLDDPHALDIQIEPRRGRLDGGAITEENGRSHPTRYPLPSGLEDAWVIPFWKNDALRMALKFFDEVRNDRHYAPQVASGND